MSIYTYNLSTKLSEIFDIEHISIPELSDQNLESFPKDYKCIGMDYVSGLIWITNGKENKYHNPVSDIPVGWEKGRTIDHMSQRDPESWSLVCKKSAQKQWKDNTGRKSAHSKKMKNTWESNYNEMAEKARKNGKHGLVGKLSPRALLLEYKGVNYYGWRELKESTGVSKDLYKKHYLNGIDPEPRIGKDGPAPSTSTADKVRQGGSS
jgi:hypothetical protein